MLSLVLSINNSMSLYCGDRFGWITVLDDIVLANCKVHSVTCIFCVTLCVKANKMQTKLSLV